MDEEMGVVRAGNMQKVHRVSDGQNGWLVEMQFPGVERPAYDFYDSLEKAQAAIDKWDGTEMEPLTQEEFAMFKVFEFYDAPEVESGWVE